MGLEEQLSQEIKDAMRAADAVRRDLLRFALNNIGYETKAKGRPLDEDEVVQVLRRQAQRHRESIEGFQKGSRNDLVEREEVQLRILEAYLPAQMGREEIVERVRRAMEEIGATGPRDKGKLMGTLMSQLRGQADGILVNQVVTELLEGADQG